MSTKPSEGAVKAADDYDVLKSDLARVTAELDQLQSIAEKRYEEFRREANAFVAAVEIEKLETRCGELEECKAFWAAEADKATTRAAELVRNVKYWETETTALRARVAELEKEAMILRGTVEAVTTQRQQAEQRKAELESNCRDLRVAYEQNASQCVQLNRELAMKPDTVEWLNGVTIQRQRAEQAEAHIADLVAALREVDEIVNDANHSAEDRLCAAANRLLNARAESATPAKHGGSAH